MNQVTLKSGSNPPASRLCIWRAGSSTERLEFLPCYDHYIALDWSKTNMSIARISNKRPGKIKIIDTCSDIKELKHYLNNQEGSKVLTIEESTPAHWLYVELRDYVDRIIICDPYRNKLLSDGPKNDPIDAKKLCSLLKSGMIKEVYHTTDELYQLRKYVSAYEDLIKMGVRLKNQRSGFLAQIGKPKKTSERNFDSTSNFILKNIDASIESYQSGKEEYEKLFEELCRKNKRLKYLKTIPGIGPILAVKIIAMVIDPKRFRSIGKYLVQRILRTYCGLVKHIAESGGRIYGKRTPRFNRVLKSVYKTAASVVINGKSPIREYYDYLISIGLTEYNARHAVARYIAKISFGILKGETRYQPYLWREKKQQKNNDDSSKKRKEV